MSLNPIKGTEIHMNVKPRKKIMKIITGAAGNINVCHNTNGRKIYILTMARKKSGKKKKLSTRLVIVRV